MNPAMSQAELFSALEARQKELNAFFSSIPEEVFLADSSTKWNPAQHLIHLTRVRSRIAQGLHAKDQLPNHETQSENYEDIRETYLVLLKQAPAELLEKNGAAVQVEANASHQQILEAYQQAATGLRKAMQTWTDADLDTKAMAHPMLGLLSVREMLEFVLYHDLHHLEGVRKVLS